MKNPVIYLLFLCLFPVSLFAQQEENVQKARKLAAHAIAVISRSARQGSADVGSSSKMYDYLRTYESDVSTRAIDEYMANNPALLRPPTAGVFYRPTLGNSRYYNNYNSTFSHRSPFEDAIATLKECQKLDPSCIIYPFEIGFAYFIDLKYKQGIKCLERLQFHKDATPILFQLLAKCYFLQKDERNGLKTLERGIERFPSAANLCLERGMYELDRKQSDEALRNFAEGINRDQLYPACYYQAFKIQYNRGNYHLCPEIGEMFLQLEPSGPRYRELSRMMFDVLARLYSFVDSAAVTEASTAELSSNTLERFGRHLISNGINEYKSGKTDSLSTNLRIFRQKVAAAGHLQAYLCWLLQFGDKASFLGWRNMYPQRWEAFVVWSREEGGIGKQ